MKRSANKRCQEIVARLVDEFWATNRGDLTQKDSEIDSDFIARGLFNSTARVGDKVGLHRRYLKRLSDSLLTSLEKDYPHLCPSTCQSELQKVLEREYASLSRKVPGWLRDSNLLQEGISSTFDQGLTKDCSEAKTSIENACALWEERWRLKKREKRIHLLKWTAGIGVPSILVIAGWFVSAWIQAKEGRDETAPRDLRREVPVDPNTGRTDLYATTKVRVDRVTDSLIREKVTRWLFIFGPDAKGAVTFHDGREVSYSGLLFEGTPRLVFWDGFIEPFLEDAIRKVLDDVGRECRDNGINPSTPLAEAANCLDNMIWRVYRKMAEVDWRLSGNSSRSPISGGLNEKVERKAERMKTKLQEQLKAAIALYTSGD